MMRTAGVDHLRQAVQGLGTVHDVDIGRALPDRGALLARHAAADPDHQIRTRLLPRAPAADFREHLLLSLLAHRAGVDQQDVRILGAARAFETVGCREQIRGTRGVVLVHLTAEGLDVELARHVRGVVRPVCFEPGKRTAIPAGKSMADTCESASIESEAASVTTADRAPVHRPRRRREDPRRTRAPP